MILHHWPANWLFFRLPALPAGPALQCNFFSGKEISCKKALF